MLFSDLLVDLPPPEAPLKRLQRVGPSEDFSRVRRLPRRVWDSADAETLARELSALYQVPGGTQTLRPVQAIALLEMSEQNGFFGPIGVGKGKTLLSLLAPVAMCAQRPLLVLPAKLFGRGKKEGKTEREKRKLAQHWRIPEFLPLVSYETISRVSGADYLETYKPDLIICDEVHKLKNPRAAVTRRFARYMKAHPDTKMVALSGTITKRSIKDFAHIAAWCLKNAAPVPFRHQELETWADAIDETKKERETTHPGVLLDFCDTLTGDDRADARRGFFRRVYETTGVVATTDADVACSLTIEGEIIQTPSELSEAWHKFRTRWELPDGHPLSDGFSIWRHARELALGFFYRWNPRPPDEWLEPRREWCRFVRDVLKTNRRGLDSELQVSLACQQHPEWYGDAEWRAWVAVRHIFSPKTECVWLSSHALDRATMWLREEKELVWAEHVAFAKELAKRTDIPYYGEGGLSEDKRSIETHTGPAILSVRSNLEGRNLQDRYSKNLIVSPNPSGLEWEQLLGRTHRDGQLADEVSATLLFGCYENINDWAQALRDADYTNPDGGHRLQIADKLMPDDWPIGDAWTK